MLCVCLTDRCFIGRNVGVNRASLNKRSVLHFLLPPSSFDSSRLLQIAAVATAIPLQPNTNVFGELLAFGSPCVFLLEPHGLGFRMESGEGSLENRGMYDQGARLYVGGQMEMWGGSYGDTHARACVLVVMWCQLGSSVRR